MMAVRTLLKRLAGMAFFHSAAGRQRLRDGAVILMLHRVLENEAQAALPHRQSLCVGPQGFETLLRWLSRHFACLPLEQVLQPPCTDKPALALTFDDGWRDNADVAYPLLQRYEIPASIFLSTDFIGTSRRFWWEAIGETLFAHARSNGAQALIEALALSGHPVPAALCLDPDERVRSRILAGYLQQLKTLHPQRLQALADLCPAPQQAHAMDWQQVAQLEGSGLIRFGPHGAGHAILTQLSDQQLHEDLLRSQRTLQRHCTAPLPVYCYPNGDQDQRIRQAVAALGYRAALGTRPGLLDGRHDPLALPRIDISHACAGHPSLLSWRLRQGARA